MKIRLMVLEHVSPVEHHESFLSRPVFIAPNYDYSCYVCYAMLCCAVLYCRPCSSVLAHTYSTYAGLWPRTQQDIVG